MKNDFLEYFKKYSTFRLLISILRKYLLMRLRIYISLSIEVTSQLPFPS